MSTTALTTHLEPIITERTAPAGADWFARNLSGLCRGVGVEAFCEAFTATARHVGRAVVTLNPPTGGLSALEADWAVVGRPLDEVARVALLTEATAHLTSDAAQALAESCYEQGDTREKQAVLRALAWLPEPERYVPLAVDACRTHIQPLFEAIACENPYPARYFSEPALNQMVLKALFIGVPLDRVHGLGLRVTPELVRMANDYASERTAAGRSVPPDIGRLTASERSKP